MKSKLFIIFLIFFPVIYCSEAFSQNTILVLKSTPHKKPEVKLRKYSKLYGRRYKPKPALVDGLVYTTVNATINATVYVTAETTANSSRVTSAPSLHATANSSRATT